MAVVPQASRFFEATTPNGSARLGCSPHVWMEPPSQERPLTRLSTPEHDAELSPFLQMKRFVHLGIQQLCFAAEIMALLKKHEYSSQPAQPPEIVALHFSWLFPLATLGSSSSTTPTICSEVKNKWLLSQLCCDGGNHP
ncbi:hypothetical protein CISG_02371 [Coccidioides immitis RMSCC 3703]|uniref:Uncharacterized protein n=2 Tax=Coccidioides immitis TaxID=5501 RepID=A0A0J8R7W3_COCIT|nr:hypothetical protein CIRG_05957 [Coccidioides immitis RMSCC 2394]KMU80520.1 hypothetical protein CISG_02371 [Coccidioides immitis RMSCC 3703]